MDTLYRDIIAALRTAKEIGMTQASIGNADVSERKANTMFGAKIVRRYKELYGWPERTGGAGNSRRRFSLAGLYELKAAENMEQGIVAFENKIRHKLIKS